MNALIKNIHENISVKNIFSWRLYIGVWPAFALVVLSSAALTYFMFALQPFESWLFERVLEENGAAVIWLNFLPILITSLILYFASNNVVLSVGVTGFIVIALSVGNRFKIIFRQDPLTTWDFVLGAELAVISRSFSPRLIFGTLGGFALIVAVTIVLLIFVRTRKMAFAARAIGLALSLAAGLISTRTFLADEHLFNHLYVSGNPYRMENQFNSRGFLYAFIHTHLTSEITRPLGFDAASVSQHVAMLEERPGEAEEAYSSPDMSRHPHVILVLAEAFSEFHLSPGITFAEGFDPGYNYRRLREESLHGYIVVPNYGGGTADAEFDILTGINTRHYRGMAYSYMMITREFPGLVSVLNSLGYHSQALHPGFAWFYNRENVFEFLGFDNYMAGDDFAGAPTRGGYVTEEYTFDRVIERFEEHLELRPDSPLFEFVITIQNHGPYDHAKHPNSYTVEFESDPPLSQADMDLLRTYFYGLADVDRELGRITDYMAAIDEPVIVIYFSDHLPLVTRGILDAHQYPNPPAAMNYDYWPEVWPFVSDFTVPFIIWRNEAAEKLLEGRTTSEESGLIMSSFSFGAFILEFMGLEQVDPFMYHINNLRKKIPVQLEFAYFDALGRRFSYDETINDDVRLYKHWSYYRLFN
ncbi:MAG: LTA synthase family protein [Defluviitaleaceae bacterium]|nr:LTA synthase family protein [Defluviitaleaceae bacterium]